MTYCDLTIDQCVEEIKRIEADPKNANAAPGSLYLFRPAARKKLEALARQITSIMRANKIARGEPVNDEGYSGRNSNRR